MKRVCTAAPRPGESGKEQEPPDSLGEKFENGGEGVFSETERVNLSRELCSDDLGRTWPDATLRVALSDIGPLHIVTTASAKFALLVKRFGKAGKTCFQVEV